MNVSGSICGPGVQVEVAFDSDNDRKQWHIRSLNINARTKGKIEEEVTIEIVDVVVDGSGDQTPISIRVSFVNRNTNQ